MESYLNMKMKHQQTARGGFLLRRSPILGDVVPGSTEDRLKDTTERCPDCGQRILFKDRMRLIYQSCPFCQQQLELPTTLALPPHKISIQDKNLDTLCMARIFRKGSGDHCPKGRSGNSQYCSTHLKKAKSKEGLPYGRIDEPYNGLHPLDAKQSAQVDSKNARRKHIELDSVYSRFNYDSIVAAAEQVVDAGVADSELLDHARVLTQTKIPRGLVTTERICQFLEPTYGIEIRGDQQREDWLKRNVEALLSLKPAPLSIIMASYGHETLGHLAMDITEILSKRLSATGGKCISILKGEELTDIFGPSPCAEGACMVRIRYNLFGQRGEVRVHTRKVDGAVYLTKDLTIQLPETRPGLKIIAASYGHCHDVHRTFDVTEHIQGLVDCTEGCNYIDLPSDADANAIFGDPCPGILKSLSITYEIAARQVEEVYIESNDHLVKPIDVFAPVVSPSLVILNAKLTKKMKRDFTKKVNKYDVSKLNNNFINKQKLEALKNTIDVTFHLRRLVDSLGGSRCELVAGESLYKLLRFTKDERAEACQKSFAKTLIVQYKALDKYSEMRVTVSEDGELMETAAINATKHYDPRIQIHGAIYGHPSDPGLQSNVVHAIENIIKSKGGESLELSSEESMFQHFGDPCFPTKVNKVLQLRYEMRRIKGSVKAQVNEDGHLNQSLFIGFLGNMRLAQHRNRRDKPSRRPNIHRHNWMTMPPYHHMPDQMH